MYINDLKYKSDFGLCYSLSFCNSLVVMGCDDRSIRLINLKTRLAYKYYAHDARVWKVLIHENRLISCGEDGGLHVFKLPKLEECEMNGSNELTETKMIELQCLLSFRGHGSKNIWTFDVDDGFVYSGGADGQIRKWALKEPKSRVLDLLDGEKKAFFWLSEIEIVVLYGDGNCIIHNLEHGTRDTIFNDAEFSKSPIMKYCHKTNMMVVGNARGSMLISNLHQNQVFHAIDGKILAVYIFGSKIFIHGGDCLVKFVISDMKVAAKNRIEIAKGLTITSAHESNGKIIIGCRSGELYVFGSNNSDSFVFSDVHGANAITGIAIENNIVCSIGRDGFYCQTSLAGKVISRQRISKGWLEELDTERIVGFYNQKLFVYLLKTQCIVASIDIGVGGGSRLWNICNVQGGLKIALGIGKSVNEYLIPSAGGQVVVQGSHSMETRAVRFHNNHVITVGEDGFALLHDNYNLVSSTRIGKSLKCLSIVDSHAFFGGSEQELAMWEISDSRLTKISQCERVSTVEFRIMDLSVIKTGHGYIIATANSDAQIRVWTVEVEDDFKFNLICQDDFHRRCVQKVQISLLNSVIYGCSGGTDGKLIFWALENEEIVILEKVQCAQSGIKAMDSCLANNILKVVIGGDDCSISFIEYDLQNKTILTHLSAIFHTSAVTGVKLLGSRIIAASMDERMSVVEITLNSLVLQYYQMLDIPDIGDLDYDDKTLRIVVVGHGMEIFKSSL